MPWELPPVEIVPSTMQMVTPTIMLGDVIDLRHRLIRVKHSTRTNAMAEPGSMEPMLITRHVHFPILWVVTEGHRKRAGVQVGAMVLVRVDLVTEAMEETHQVDALAKTSRRSR
jgi:hypothetical protein